jgi:hypothetical protein
LFCGLSLALVLIFAMSFLILLSFHDSVFVGR